MGMGTVGLSILLETHHRHHHHHQYSMNTNTQILNKFSLPKPPSSSTYSSPLPSPTFLDSCFLCKKSLPPGKDIYMYRGDRAFCSVECRCRQIFLDESRENNISSSSSPHSRERRKRSGGVAF